MQAELKRIPKHIGVIPDGNRRWAEERGMGKEQGYRYGVDAGFTMYEMCRAAGVEELTLYGFTQDNTKRPVTQRREFQEACVNAVERLTRENASLLVVGNSDSDMFPRALVPFTRRRTFGEGGIRVNFLVNYDWAWDIAQVVDSSSEGSPRKLVPQNIGSWDVSRIDLLIRWGGRRRLSGFLPVQSVYADIYVVDTMWPDFEPNHFWEALKWYQDQDVTLGG